MVREISAIEFEKIILSEKGSAVIDCYADWCMPCKMYALVFEEVANELGDKIPFYKLNVDAAPAVAHLYGIQGVPSTLLFKDGELKAKMTGLLTAEDLKAWVLNNL